ncbi:MAG: YraN family protein [Flavobacteriales bacterium CG18_big_fil_WC_8_21_14_2_50_32_9]|nr:YraN family protein [Flavobacteriales bacterium]PIQ16057.1 MAG: YraN family protein [Flavobacteriales bacterium CG18_big_fil_WC_8_21_14_2_50_32_9]PJC62484.1 MAG: YraN family protein [Flavobacteriales bacterium CG_4_9_14_0_2_um_filter_32_27]
MAEHNLLGKKGEEKAVEFLKKLGYEIVATNWLEQKFEIDIIAKDGNEFVFVEVKTRSTDFFGTPEEAVTPAKQNHLIEGADFYIQQHEIDLEARFDVIAIVLNKQNITINHFKAAFYP